MTFLQFPCINNAASPQPHLTLVQCWAGLGARPEKVEIFFVINADCESQTAHCSLAMGRGSMGRG